MIDKELVNIVISIINIVVPIINDYLDNHPNAMTSEILEFVSKQDNFYEDAEEEIYKISNGIPWQINDICEKILLYAYQQQKRLIDGHMVRFVADNELLQIDEAS